MNSSLIQKQRSILDALQQIDSLPARGSRTLFVVDEGQRVIGSLSDGDCRRFLIRARNLDAPVEQAMHRDFISLRKDASDIALLKKIKNLGIQYVPELNPDGTFSRIVDFSGGKSFLPVDAVLMAGGKGERLRPLTLKTPKPLLEVDGKPIIEYNVENLLHYGITDINVTVNYLAGQLEAYFAEKSRTVPARFTCIHEPQFLGTMGAVRFVPAWQHDTVLLMNSDLFTNINLEAFYFSFVESGADMCVAGVPYNVNIPYGIFSLKEDGTVTGMQEKPSFYYYANAGIYLFKRSLIDMIPRDRIFHSTDMIELLIKNNLKVTQFPIAGYWIDIGKPEDFKKVQEFAKNLNRREQQ